MRQGYRATGPTDTGVGFHLPTTGDFAVFSGSGCAGIAPRYVYNGMDDSDKHRPMWEKKTGTLGPYFLPCADPHDVTRVRVVH